MTRACVLSGRLQIAPRRAEPFIMSTRRKHLVTSILVTHDMRTARKVADRVVMFYPLSRLGPDEPQVIYDGPPSDLDKTSDRRVSQFIHGEAGERLNELREARNASLTV